MATTRQEETLSGIFLTLGNTGKGVVEGFSVLGGIYSEASS